MKLPFVGSQRRLYLDFASITPVSRRVQKSIADSYTYFYNPSSIHTEGVTVHKRLATARKLVADEFRAHSDEIIFTASGTESCVLAVRGVVEAARKEIAQPHIIVSAIEHPAVLETARALEAAGHAHLSILSVDESGLVNVSELAKLIRTDTVLVSIQYTNNEIGVCEPIRDIGLLIAKMRGHNTYPVFHSDASQAVLYEELNTTKLHVDLMTIDGIKCYGPRGIGVLYKRRGVTLVPLMTGGGHEGGMRSGTENYPAIYGLADALVDAREQRESETVRLSEIRTYARDEIRRHIPQARVHESQTHQSPHILNICFPGSDAEYIVLSLDALGIAVSATSACRSLHGDTSSYVVSALGDESCATSSIRFSFGRETQRRDIDRLLRALKELVHRQVIPSPAP